MGNTASEQENGFTKSSSYSALNIQNRNGHIYANANNSNSSGNINGHLHGIGGAIKQRPVPVISVGTHRKKSVSTTSLSSLNAKFNNNKPIWLDITFLIRESCFRERSLPVNNRI